MGDGITDEGRCGETQYGRKFTKDEGLAKYEWLFFSGVSNHLTRNRPGHSVNSPVFTECSAFRSFFLWVSHDYKRLKTPQESETYTCS